MIYICWRSILVLLLVIATPARAAVMWSFEITNPVQTVLPSETITFNATIHNAPESTESLIIGTPCALCVYPVGFLIAQGDFTSDLYSFDEGSLGTDRLVDSLAGSVIPAGGGSKSFAFYSLIPIAPVPAGVYRAEFNSLYLNGYGSYAEGGPVQATVVPLPAGFVLLVSGMAAIGLTMLSRRTHAKSSHAGKRT